MSHTMLRPFIVNVSVLGYFPLYIFIYIWYGMVWYQIRVNPRKDKEAFAYFLVINPF